VDLRQEAQKNARDGNNDRTTIVLHLGLMARHCNVDALVTQQQGKTLEIDHGGIRMFDLAVAGEINVKGLS
jgi:hypothetical protein